MVAYHALVRTLETFAHRPLLPQQTFSAAVGHVLNGFVPTKRFHDAGRLAGTKRHSESAVAKVAADELRVDLNPLLKCMVHAATRYNALLVHQSLNQYADLPVRTEVGFDSQGTLTFRSRTESLSGDDPTACRDTHLMGMDIILSSIAESGTQTVAASEIPAWGGRRLRPPECVSGLAALLGLGSSVVSDAALAFEADAAIKVQDVARHLGCHSRTLQREFKASGLTAETLKRACMLSRATALLSTAMTLTDIAHEAGYADHAHMTRAFVKSCALPPSILRQAFTGPITSTKHGYT